MVNSLSTTWQRPVYNSNSAHRTAPAGESAPPEAADLLSLSGAPLAGPSSASLAQQNRIAALAASPGQDLVGRYFTAQEFAALNPGRYHNPDHPVLVAEVAGELAGPQRSEFLQQVALLHDADERLDLKTGSRNEVSPARAQVTLEWMDRNETALSQRFGWDAVDFTEAKALIARTDFPFNDQARNFGTRYDGQSPVGVYRQLLSELPAERQVRVMEEGLALRFADQVANYTVNSQVSEAFVAGLSQELHWPEVRSTTPSFLKSVGSDLDFDRQLAAELHIPARLAPGPELKSRLTPARQAALVASEEWFVHGPQ
jgi:hypothetical protein